MSPASGGSRGGDGGDGGDVHMPDGRRMVTPPRGRAPECPATGSWC